LNLSVQNSWKTGVVQRPVGAMERRTTTSGSRAADCGEGNMKAARARHKTQRSTASASPTHALTADEANDDDLVARLKRGDQDAFRQAIVRFSPRMLATARAIVGPTCAEDVVQDSWLAVLNKIQGFEERSALTTWLVRIVSNRAVSHLRSQSREVNPSPAHDDEAAGSDWFDESGRWSTPPPSWSEGSPEDLLSAEALHDCLDKHLHLMPDQQRLVLVMRDMEQQSYTDICNEMGLSASNVRVLLHRGRLRLMNMVNGFQKSGTC